VVTARMAAAGLRAARRAVAVAGAGLLLATLAVTGTAAVAQAATCPGTSEQVVKPVGTADFTWAPCSDSSVQVWNGTIHDTLCDNRKSGVKIYEEFEKPGTTTWKDMAWTDNYSADGGCGSYDSFPRIVFARQSDSAGADCGTCEHRLKIEVFACSGAGLNCSSDYWAYFYFYYPGAGGVGGCAEPPLGVSAAASGTARVPETVPC